MGADESSDLDDASDEITVLAEQQDNLFTFKQAFSASPAKIPGAPPIPKILQTSQNTFAASSSPLSTIVEKRSTLLDTSSSEKRIRFHEQSEFKDYKKSRDGDFNPPQSPTKAISIQKRLDGIHSFRSTPNQEFNKMKYNKTPMVDSTAQAHLKFDHASMEMNQISSISLPDSRDPLPPHTFPTLSTSFPEQRVHQQSYIPGPAGKLPILTVEERRELFRKEVETEQCRRHKIQIELQKLQATPSLRSQIANKLSVTKKENLTISRLSTDSVAWRNMLEVNPEYKEDYEQKCVGPAKFKGGCIKIPTLMVLMDKFRKMERGAGAVFKHYYGEIRGGIDKSVLDFFGLNISQGAVLHLREVSIIRPTIGLTFLNITLKNVVCLFPAKGVPPCVYNTTTFFPSRDSKGTRSEDAIEPLRIECDTSSLNKQFREEKDLFDTMKFEVPTEDELEKILACDKSDDISD